MFSNKSSLAVLASICIGGASAFTGTATLGIGAGSTSCECPTQNTAFGIAIPAALMGSNMCCNVQVQLAFGERTSAAVLDAIYDTGAGTENIALSPAAFAALSPGFINQTSLSPVTWSFF